MAPPAGGIASRRGGGGGRNRARLFAKIAVPAFITIAVVTVYLPAIFQFLYGESDFDRALRGDGGGGDSSSHTNGAGDAAAAQNDVAGSKGAAVPAGTSGVAGGSIDKTQYKYPPVSCPDLLRRASAQAKQHLIDHPEQSTAKNSTIGPESYHLLDPNLGEVHSRLTDLGVDKPNFHISVHRSQIDPVRWGIMTKGKYYEFDMTDHFIDILGGKKNDKGTSGGGGGGDKGEKQPRGLVIDVGMNIGWFTLLSAAMGHDVIAFDANYIHHVRVCQSIDLNQWNAPDHSTPQIETYQYGLGDQPGKLDLTYGLANSGSATFTRVNKSFRHRVQRPVDVITLDDFAEERGWFATESTKPSIKLLKVDVESFEPQVFAGASRFVSARLADEILSEFTLAPHKRVRPGIGKTVKQLIDARYDLKLVGNWAGNGEEFERIGRNEMPQDKSSPKYADELTAFLFDFAEKHNYYAINMWWSRGDEAAKKSR